MRVDQCRITKKRQNPVRFSPEELKVLEGCLVYNADIPKIAKELSLTSMFENRTEGTIYKKLMTMAKANNTIITRRAQYSTFGILGKKAKDKSPLTFKIKDASQVDGFSTGELRELVKLRVSKLSRSELIKLLTNGK